MIVSSHSLLSKKRKSCPLFERVSYVWRSRKEEKESKEQSHVFGAQGRGVKEQRLDISHMFGVQGRECIYYKTRHMHFVLTHTLQNERNGFKDTSS